MYKKLAKTASADRRNTEFINHLSAPVLDFADVPYSSSNVPFPMHDFNGVFHFYAYYYNGILSFTVSHVQIVTACFLLVKSDMLDNIDNLMLGSYDVTVKHITKHN